MNPIQLMELHKDTFTQNDHLIHRAIMSDLEQVITKTTSQLAADCGVSQPALTRFVKSLGYDRYRDFRSDVAAWLASKSVADTGSSLARLPYFTTLEETLKKTEEVLTDEYLMDLTRFIAAHRRIYATGSAKSLQPAQLFEILMRRNKLGVHAVSHDSLDELVDYMDSSDLLVVFSASAREKNLVEIGSTESDVLLVTTNPHYAMNENVTRAVVLPFAGINAETSSVSPILFDVFVELVTHYMAATA